MSTKVHLVKTMVFPVVMYGCESWTVKKAECQKIDAFEMWCWRRLLEVPWIARRSNQWILKQISPEYSLEGLMLSWNSNTSATWWEELTHWKRPWGWERLKAGGEGDYTGWDDWMTSPTQWTCVSARSESWWWEGRKEGKTKDITTRDIPIELGELRVRTFRKSLPLTKTLLLNNDIKRIWFCQILFQVQHAAYHTEF